MNRIVEIINDTEWKINGGHDNRALVVDKANQVWVCVPLYYMAGYTVVKPLFKWYE